MAELKPHIKLNTSLQKEAPVTLKYNYGFDDKKDEKAFVIKDYKPMARTFRTLLNRFDRDIIQRREQRNEAIQVPVNIEYIKIIFQDQFDIKKYLQSWYDDFGLLGINFTQFNHEILFKIDDFQKFENLINSIKNFVDKEENDKQDLDYNGKVTYIKSFKFLTSADIIQYREFGSLMNIRLLDFPINDEEYNKILEYLFSYLNENKIEHNINTERHFIEIIGVTDNFVLDVVRNFDIVYSVTSSLSTRIAPNEYNLPQRSYGFEIANPNDDLPIIGIVDTGISQETPLKAITIQDDSFQITNSSALQDSTDHGTGVAAFAALGKRPYFQNYQGSISADAKLLSIKILDSSSGYLSQIQVIELLNDAKSKYPELKIFVLTIGYDTPKKVNEDFSTYAYELDKFAHINNCIICICTTNNDEAQLKNSKYDVNYFYQESTNLCVPADSMNNIVVGASADSIFDKDFEGISLSKEYPTLFTRKSHIDLSLLFPKTKINKNYFRPDVIESGGDYEHHPTANYIFSGSNASLQVLSANPQYSFNNYVGTSYSAPLVANIAAQIQKKYPTISAQSIKALILNGASLHYIRFDEKHQDLLKKVAGYGIANDFKSIHSSESSATFILEDSITPEETKLFPINFPKYLITEDLKKKSGILKVTATLCFSFEPLLNFQLGYCPIHIGFGFFKNQSADDIQKSESDIPSLLKSTLRWSQTARHKSKPIPFTNSQKLTFNINVKDLINENCTFKLAINARINPQLLPGFEVRYNHTHNFSIAIRIEEDLPESEFKNKLYDELINCNEVENIIGIDLENTDEINIEA